MNAHVRRLADVEGFAPLVAESRAAGIGFVERLVREFEAGTNRFDAPGEGLFGAFAGERLVGCAGLNVDPYANDPALARVRHVYVLEAQRRSGVGTALMDAVLTLARARFARIRLKTETEAAVRFYESLGFSARSIEGGFELARAL